MSPNDKQLPSLVQETRDAQAFQFPATAKSSRGDIILVPQPNDDPSHPLNWKSWRKYCNLMTLCFAAFSGATSVVANESAYPIQARTYHKSSIKLSYSVSAEIAGLAGGPLILAPLISAVGASPVILWSLVLTLGCQVWSALMTNAKDYIPFVVSRLFVGISGSLPTVVGAQQVVDMFFLHERGRALLIYNISLLFGTLVGPTFGGFIVDKRPWPLVFWWTIALLGLAIVLVLFFLESTHGVDREVRPKSLKNFLWNRATTFCSRSPGCSDLSLLQIGREYATLLGITIYPITILAGMYMFVAFGFALMLVTLLAIFLQTPIKAGGYGFAPVQNAEFTFTLWVGLLFAEVYGFYANDRIPLWAAKRNDLGIWYPEYRLYSLILPAIALPVGLAICGITLQLHLHYMVLAFGTFLVAFSGISSVPICVNYVIECYTTNAIEVSVVMGVYRLTFGLVIPFFILPWEKKVGIGWIFGMAAIFSSVAALMILLLIWKGHRVRELFPPQVCTTDEGKKIRARCAESILEVNC